MFGDNIIPGNQNTHYSHRSELGGIIGGLHHILNTCDKFEIANVRIKAYCDGQEAINKADRAHFKPTTSISHFDLVTTLHFITKSILGVVEFPRMKGHQIGQVKI